MYCYVKLKAKDEVFPGGAVKTIKEKNQNPKPVSKTVSLYQDQVGCNLILSFGT